VSLLLTPAAGVVYRVGRLPEPFTWRLPVAELADSGPLPDLGGGRWDAPSRGGLVQDVDGASPCRIDVTAQFVVRGRTWAELDIEHLSLAPDEIERRARQHDTAEIRRLQDLGSLPPDEDLDEA
jgi:hypothetical protein